MEYFVLPHNGLYVLYVPLRKLAFLVNSTVITALKLRGNNETVISFPSDCQNILDLLDATSIFEHSPALSSTTNSSYFKPTCATLFLTNRCNLRCVYCYASAGEFAPITMPWKVAKAAVDYVVHNAIELGEKSVQIGFHGGGEPTLAWGLLKRIVIYFKQVTSVNDLSPSVHIATNGVIFSNRLSWITDNFTCANISLDGLPEIQNTQRPTIKGMPSFDCVWSTIKYMDRKNFNYGIRATVTKQSVEKMGAFTKYIIENSNCQQLHFEPTFSCGRCVHSGIDSPSVDEFIDGYREACAATEGHTLELMYSGARLNTLTDRFCQAVDGSFCLTPSGDITSCYEITSSDDHRSSTFFYGRYDCNKNDFIIFEDKLKKLQQRTVNLLDYCNNCFCKYHCAGDCPTRSTDGHNLTKILNNSRCTINQTLTLDQIVKRLPSIDQ